MATVLLRDAYVYSAGLVLSCVRLIPTVLFSGCYDLPKDANYHVFRGDALPMWESFPDGGCWIYRVARHSENLGRYWEDLLMAMIGEQFQDESVVGAEVSIRSKGCLLSLWISDHSRRFAIGNEFRSILNITHDSTLEYKANNHSMQDHSTFHHTKPYLVAAKSKTLSPKRSRTNSNAREKERESRAAERTVSERETDLPAT